MIWSMLIDPCNSRGTFASENRQFAVLDDMNEDVTEEGRQRI